MSPFAYLDPGSGSFLIQIILGGAAAVMVGLRLGWRYVWASLFQRGTKEDNNHSS